MRDDLKPGNPFPDFELPDQDGGLIRMSEYMNGKPIALTFNRGNF